MIVSFSLKNQIIKRTDKNVPVSGSKNYLYAQFTPITDDWTRPITAVFNGRKQILDENLMCEVPWEELQKPGIVRVSAFCGDLITSSVALMELKPGGNVDGEISEPPTPDVYAQLTQMVQGAVDTANSVQQRADSGEFDGRPGEPGAAGQDGFSPIATVKQTADGATINITDKAGTTTATVKNGEPGPQGEQGPQGEPGPQGPAGLNAPQIDDTKITTANPWSSAKIVETVCPPFEMSGPIVTCNPVAGHPLHVVSQIVPVQEGEGDPSPENIRPITGWTEANLWHGGKNLVSLGDSIESVMSGVILGKNSIRSNINNYYFVYFRIPTTLSNKLRPGMALTLSIYTGAPGKNLTLVVRGYDSNGSVVAIEKSSVPGGNSVTCYVPDNISVMDYVECRFNRGSERFTDTETIIDGIQLEIGDTKTIFQPPTFKNITLPFGQTVYSGTLDWTTGVLTITHEKVIFDGSEEWIFGSPYNGYTLSKERKYKDGFLPICNIAKGAIENQITGYSIRANYNSFRFQGFADKYPDADSFKAFLQTQNAEIIAELVTPITVQLTHQEILGLSGVNTIYTDIGDTTVSGLADPVATLQQLAERIEALQSMSTAVTQLSELDAAYREGVNSV